MADEPRNLPSDQDASGRTFGPEERALLDEVLTTGTLTSTKGTAVKRLEERFAELLGVKHAFACTSGTAAVHLAVTALDPEPGDEIITTPITDMGALTPIVYQGAIPVFADVDPDTLNVTPETVEARLSGRTRAIIATHLFGRACDMDGLRALGERHGIPVIEDAAQAYGTTWRTRPVGGLGAIGCFSLQQGKHVTTGEGGLVTTDDDAYARRVFLAINKAWGYGDSKPDHYFLALNYRMNEITGAVALAQLDKLAGVVADRVARADELTKRLEGTGGLTLPGAPAGDVHSYWKYCINVDGDRIDGGAAGLGRFLQERGIACAPRYIQKPAYRCEVFRDQRTFGNSRWPFTLAREEALDWSDARYPGALRGLERVLVLPWNERYTADDVRYVADAILEGTAALRRAA